MILNVLSVVLLFVDAVCVALALLLAACAVRQLARARQLGRVEILEAFERGLTLVLLVSLTLVGLRVLSWPLLYATLAGFVPTIEGAMCIYGVTQAAPVLAKVVEAAKPVILFLAGGWVLLNRLDRRSMTSPLARPNTAFLLVLALLVLAEALLEIALVVGIRPTFVVTCCTTVADVAARPTSVIPQALLGGAYAGPLAVAFFVLLALLAGAAFLGAFSRLTDRRGPAAALLLVTGSALALAAVPLGYLATVEVLAPAWMGLPYHHCAYCFLATADAPLAVAAFFLGILSFWWAGLLHAAGRHPELPPLAAPMTRRCLAWSGFLLCGAAGMALIHLVTA